MADANNQLNLASAIAIRIAARDPAWAQQPDSDPALPPQSAASGVALADAPVTLVSVRLREVLRARSARITLASWVAGDSITITVNGTNVVYDSTGDADVAQAYTDLADAINADGTVGPLVTATAVDTDGDTVIDAVDLLGDAQADYTLDGSVVGTGTVSIEADPSGCNLVLSASLTAAPSFTAPGDWFVDASPDLPRIVTPPLSCIVFPWRTGGYLRGHVQILNLFGPSGDGAAVTLRTPTIQLGPGLSETS